MHHESIVNANSSAADKKLNLSRTSWQNGMQLCEKDGNSTTISLRISANLRLPNPKNRVMKSLLISTPLQHFVYSTNLLSRKHVCSQICDDCNLEPISVRCANDNLVLYRECDLGAHSTCPTTLDLASICGFDLEEEKDESLH
ncbi:hypothetical protein SADUNF_Sadunf16G0278600 [Salix dunnii]|uniref:Uncharacterized protein n=1 Tax=Salix dunnii TaxID=1413687 RepID=A0A835JDQ6_9ROSI|nr:hypothetical protein SADUNF_Sadunf16G0278600 [Salix dunnii]